jgi:hypothetical protein
MDLGAPVAYAVLNPGTPVYSSDDQEIGKVSHVLAAEDEDVFDGIVIGEHLFGEEHRFADADDIEAIFERGVVLKLDRAACSHARRPGRVKCRVPSPKAQTRLGPDLRQLLTRGICWATTDARYLL